MEGGRGCWDIWRGGLTFFRLRQGEGLLYLGHEWDCVMDTNENGLHVCVCVCVGVCEWLPPRLLAGAHPQAKRHTVKKVVLPKLQQKHRFSLPPPLAVNHPGFMCQNLTFLCLYAILVNEILFVKNVLTLVD